jgi:hypothetical protein
VDLAWAETLTAWSLDLIVVRLCVFSYLSHLSDVDNHLREIV